jgi:hypothetical protein
MSEHIPAFSTIYDLLTHVGYTLPSALLEISDNSIVKNASEVHTIIVPEEDGTVDRIIVMDDAIGMTAKQLNDAWTIGNPAKRTNRDNNDIGRFHTGLKSAAFNLGRDITIVTKHAVVVGADTVIESSALRADIGSMKIRESFDPTEKVPFNDEFAVKWLPPAVAAKFAESRTGTLVQIRYLNTMAIMVKPKADELLKKALSNAYMLETKCKLYLNGVVVPSVDAFYRDGNGIDHRYSTTLSLYKADTPGGPIRVVETNTSRRNGQGSKKIDWGYPGRPAYFEYRPIGKGDGYFTAMKPITSPPNASEKIGPDIPVTMVQVSQETYRAETAAGILPDNRSGITIRRNQRVVGHAMKLGHSLGKRSVMATEYQRMEIVTSPEHDNAIGLQFNKKLSDQSLPSVELTDALFSIYKQVSAPWAKEWQNTHKAENDDSEESEDEAPTLDAFILPSPPRVAPIQIPVPPPAPPSPPPAPAPAPPSPPPPAPPQASSPVAMVLAPPAPPLPSIVFEGRTMTLPTQAAADHLMAFLEEVMPTIEDPNYDMLLDQLEEHFS